MEALHTIRTADECRERARQFFALAVAEDDPGQREAWLVQGERWMQRWRYWTPSQNIVEYGSALYTR